MEGNRWWACHNKVLEFDGRKVMKRSGCKNGGMEEWFGLKEGEMPVENVEKIRWTI